MPYNSIIIKTQNYKEKSKAPKKKKKNLTRGLSPCEHANNVLPSYVAWIAKSDIPANARWEVTFDDDITVTGIEEVRSKRAEGRSAAVYDLQGRKVAISHQPSSISHTKKGLYIVNGHKVVVK